MLSSAVSLPPVGQLNTLRSDIDTALAESSGPSPSALHRPTGHLSMPASPHQMDTPTLGQRPTSPFAMHSGQEHTGESPDAQQQSFVLLASDHIISAVTAWKQKYA